MLFFWSGKKEKALTSSEEDLACGRSIPELT
jgi:hypothetical protein